MNSEWIPVESAMPEGGVRVLTYGPAMGIYTLHRWHDEWRQLLHGAWRYAVTHWMPLPDEPGEE